VGRLGDPKITLASMASILIGAAAAAADGRLAAWPLALTVLGIFFIEVAKNASGEIFDLQADRGVRPEERTPFSGGKRVLVDGLLTMRQTWAVAIGGYALGAIVGGLLAFREPRILPICLLGLASAYFYQGWPIRLC
jgi:1,4-dihydroxy-2-naphthoate octaprenyltransferase